VNEVIGRSDMQQDEDLKHETCDADSKADNPSASTRIVLLSGFSILVLSFLIGIAASFYQWDSGSPFDLENWSHYNPVGRATYAPLAFALMLFPITIPVLIVLTVPIFIGIIWRKLWPLSILGFLGIGGLWLWYITELWKFD
jgi:hypothetical protein